MASAKVARNFPLEDIIATCPKEGIVVNGFTLNQLKAQVDAIMENA